jgi:hypothetical protein
MPILITKKLYSVLDTELKSYIRQIVNKFDQKIMCYDIGGNRPNSYNPYINGDFHISNENALIGRKSYEGMILDNTINMSDIVKKDPEIIFVKAMDSLAFNRYYKLAYSAFVKKSYDVAIRNLELALKLRPNDSLCDGLMLSVKKEKIFLK